MYFPVKSDAKPQEVGEDQAQSGHVNLRFSIQMHQCMAFCGWSKESLNVITNLLESPLKWSKALITGRNLFSISPPPLWAGEVRNVSLLRCAHTSAFPGK